MSYATVGPMSLFEVITEHMERTEKYAPRIPRIPTSLAFLTLFI